jgi:hypothetical protein
VRRGTLEHPKTIRLARELGIRVSEAMGLICGLVDWAYYHAIRGDIGKWDDDEIARGARCECADGVTFVEALVRARWVDRHETHRLVIHDLHEHADDTWKKQLARKHLTFANLDPGIVQTATGQSPGNVRTMSGQSPDRGTNMASACRDAEPSGAEPCGAAPPATPPVNALPERDDRTRLGRYPTRTKPHAWDGTTGPPLELAYPVPCPDGGRWQWSRFMLKALAGLLGLHDRWDVQWQLWTQGHDPGACVPCREAARGPKPAAAPVARVLTDMTGTATAEDASW